MCKTSAEYQYIGNLKDKGRRVDECWDRCLVIIPNKLGETLKSTYHAFAWRSETWQWPSSSAGSRLGAFRISRRCWWHWAHRWAHWFGPWFREYEILKSRLEKWGICSLCKAFVSLQEAFSSKSALRLGVSSAHLQGESVSSFDEAVIKYDCSPRLLEGHSG